MKLAIVIIHYNTSEDLGRCLSSLEAYPPRDEHRVVVVDNASQDEGLADVHRRHPDCAWIFNGENLGYAKGCNRGLEAVEADYYLILNPDVVVQPGSLDRLLEFADRHPRAGIVGPQLLNEDGSIQHSCRRFYTLKTLLMRRTFLGRIFPDSVTVRRHLMLDFDHTSERPVDWVLGGCMLARHEAIGRVGPMDERFFLYFEDVDWCFRMWRAGFEVVYTPDARFTHRHRRSSAQGTFSPTFWSHLGSLISFYEKWGAFVWLLKKWRDPLLLVLLWLLDMAGLAAAFGLAYAGRALAQGQFSEPLYPFAEYRPLLYFAWLLASVTFLMSGRYRPGHLRRPRAPLAHLQQVGVVSVLLLASTYLGHLEVVSRAVLLGFIPLFALLTGLAERLLHRGLRRLEVGHLSLERTLMVGDPTLLRAWLADAGDLTAQGVDVAGYLAEPGDAEALPPLAGGVPWLGRPVEAADMAVRYRISQVVFWTLPGRGDPLWCAVGALRRLRIRLRWQVDGAWLLAARAHAEVFGGRPSAVQATGGRRAMHALVRRLSGLAGGVALGTLGLLPWLLWRVGAARRNGRMIRPELVDRWGQITSLRLAVDSGGQVLALPWQWPLAADLLTGRLNLWGDRARPAATAVASAENDPLEFWNAEPSAPGLTGPWARPAVWGRLWRDPGGFGTVAQANPEIRSPQEIAAPGGEAGESCEHES